VRARFAFEQQAILFVAHSGFVRAANSIIAHAVLISRKVLLCCNEEATTVKMQTDIHTCISTTKVNLARASTGAFNFWEAHFLGSHLFQLAFLKIFLRIVFFVFYLLANRLFCSARRVVICISASPGTTGERFKISTLLIAPQ
jgi:hypothetical protein